MLVAHEYLAEWARSGTGAVRRSDRMVTVSPRSHHMNPPEVEIVAATAPGQGAG